MSDHAGLADLNRAAEQVWLAAQPAWPDLSVEVLAEVGSTNAHALDLGRQGQTGPAVVVAWRQTAGRGRAGRAWQARPGGSLTMSLGLPLRLDTIPGGGSALSLAAGLWVAEALAPLLPAEARPRLRLKWPNDLWVDDRKLAGLLIEAIQGAALPPAQRWVVIGLGLNLAGTPPDEQASRCDLAALGASLTPGEALQAVVRGMLAELPVFEQTGFAPLQARYGLRDALHGRPVALWRHQAGPTPPDARGTALGVSAQGALMVSPGPGTPPMAWTIGEASVRPDPL